MEDRAFRFYATQLLNPVDVYRLKREREREKRERERQRDRETEREREREREEGERKEGWKKIVLTMALTCDSSFFQYNHVHVTSGFIMVDGHIVIPFPLPG